MSVLGKRKAEETNQEQNKDLKRPKIDSNDDDEGKCSKNKRKKKNKRGQPPTKGNRIEKIPSYYFFLNGYRYIAPYDFEYRCFAKGRWFKRTIYEVMTSEFVAYDADYYKNAILNGRILVCGNRVSLDYIVKNGDWISHKIHRHEPPILHREIKIIEETENILVINKPSGIAIHPCGKYRYNTLVYVLFNELQKELYSTHRLDRVTSGLMLLCKNKETAKRIGQKIRDRNMTKTYLARVKGKFPLSLNDESECKEAEIITVNQPIRCKNHQKGIHEIHEDGKEAVTHFKFLSFDGESSLVQAQPKHGRTHQIRLHLQYLGHPIVNDFNYGGKEQSFPHWVPEDEEEKSKLIDNLKKHWNDDCDECKTILKEINGEQTNIRNSAPEIWLHALKYECDDFCFAAPMPDWA